MPGVERLSIDLLVAKARKLTKLGIPAIAIFPVVSDDVKTGLAEEAYNSRRISATSGSRIEARSSGTWGYN